jgi:hypothetical protein
MRHNSAGTLPAIRRAAFRKKDRLFMSFFWWPKEAL